MSTPPAGGQGSPYGENHCPRCGAPHDPLQEYCLECGLRLVALPRERYTRTIVWSRESPVWLWIALAALLLVALAAGGIVALAATDDDKEASPGVSSQRRRPCRSRPRHAGHAHRRVHDHDPAAHDDDRRRCPRPRRSRRRRTQPTTTTPGTIISWPAGTDGYTVVLKSTPAAQGRGPADAAAQQAINAGLRQVGVLNSSDYSSLNPGYYVTFTGVYATENQAEAALPNARSKGFPTAYVRRRRRLTRAGPCNGRLRRDFVTAAADRVRLRPRSGWGALLNPMLTRFCRYFVSARDTV